MDREDLLVAELREAGAGYLSRDNLVQESFTRVSGLFVAFMALLLTFNHLGPAQGQVRTLCVLSIALAGLLAMAGITEDLASTAGVRLQLRKRASLLREQLRASPAGKDDVFWERLDEIPRPRFAIERILGVLLGDGQEAEVHLYLASAYVMIFLWVVVAAVIWLAGPALDLRMP